MDLFISNGYEEGDQNGKKGQKLQLLKRLHLCKMTASNILKKGGTSKLKYNTLPSE